MMSISKKAVFSIILLLISQTIFADKGFGQSKSFKKSPRSSAHSVHKQKPTYKARRTQREPAFNPPSRNHSYHYYKPGYKTHYLPYGSRRLFFNDLEYFFFDGYFYRPYRNEYQIVAGPIGAIVLSLPTLHFSLHWNGMDYFLAGNTYYRRHPRGYVVIRNPGFSRDRWR